MKHAKYLWLLLTMLLATVGAHAQFNPSDPPEPGVPVVKYTVSGRVIPNGAGYVNPSSASAQAGENVTLTAHAYSNYVFARWTDESGNVVGTGTTLTVKVHAHNTSYTAHFTYSPSSPSEPSVPDEYASLSLYISPSNSGYTSGAGRYIVGSNVRISASAYSNYTFKNWTRNGEVVSTSPSFNYVMQKGSNMLTANFVYSPGSPGEPNTPEVKKKVYMSVIPANAGYVNPSSGNSYAVGTQVSLNAYSYTNYSFQYWSNSDGDIISKSSNFSYTVPDKDSRLTANYAYTPASPGEPGRPDARRNVIYGMRRIVTPGSEVMYDVLLENTDNVVSMNVDVAIPEGYEADFDRIVTGKRAQAHSLSVQTVSEGIWRIFLQGTASLSGGNGLCFSFPIKVPADAEPGTSVTVGMSKGVVYTADGAQTATEAIDGIIKIAETAIELPNSPDFAIEDISTATAGEVNPGDILSIGWKVSNKGTADANGGWNETVSIVDTKGSRTILGTIYCPVSTLAKGESVSRRGDFTIPELPGLAGKLNIAVTVTPDVSCGEIDEYKGNNSATGSGEPVELSKCLRLTIPESIEEGKQTSIRCRLDRSGYWNNTEYFNLAMIKGDERLHLPDEVRILKGQSGAYFLIDFTDNATIDDNTEFIVKVSGSDYPPTEKSFSAVDDEFPEIELSIDSESIGEGQSAQLTLTLPRATAEDLVINLWDDSGRLTLPESVTIPAGETSATVTVTATENYKIENDIAAIITATAPHYETGDAFVLVKDNDMPILSLEISPEEVSEGAGPGAIRCKLSRSGNTGSRITLLLSDDLPNTLSYTSKIVMEKGVTDYDFNIGVIDNNRAEGNRTVTLTAAVFISHCSCSATGESGGAVDRTITVIDNDGPSLSIKSSNATLRKDMRSTTLTIERNTWTDNVLTVNLKANPADLLNLPDIVTIPAGKSSVTLDVEALESAFTGSEKTVSLSAEAEGFAKGTSLMLISDRTLPDATVSISGYFADGVMPGARIKVKATVTNNGNTTMPDAVPIDFYLGTGQDILVTINTARALGAGESEELTAELTAPAIPGEYLLKARVNDANNFQELTRTNNASNDLVLRVLSPFTPSVEADRASCMPSEKVRISGYAKGYKGEVEVYYIMNGARRTVNVVPEEDGHFQTDITPLYAGDYSTGICVPGENKSDAMTSFSARGFRIENSSALTFDVAVGSEYIRNITITNCSSVPVTGLKVTPADTPDGCTANIECPDVIPANGSVTARIAITGTEVSEGKDWETFPVNVTAEGCESDFRTVYFYCRPGTARLTASVSSINTTVTAGSPRVYRLAIGNTGKANTGDITLSLPTFMQQGTATTLPSIAMGETANVDIVLTATPEMQLNVPVTGKIGINCKNGDGIALPYTIEPVSSEIGTLRIDVKDEYTFYTEAGPHVEGADIFVTHPVTDKLIASGKTGADGIWETELGAGFYTVEISAQKHESKKGTLQIAPGTVNYEPVFLPFNAITYDWHVVETTVDDSYEIVTTVDFETRVPKPVIVVNFPELEFRNQIAYISITNKGLVAAQNVEVIVPESDEEMQFEVIGESQIPILHAGENRMVPIRISVFEENAYPKLTLTTNSYSYTGTAAGNESGASLSPRRHAPGGGCRTYETDVLVDDIECDPVTGLAHDTGKKKTIQGTYRTGNCGSPGNWTLHPGFHGSPTYPSIPSPGTPLGGSFGPQLSSGGADTYWSDHLRDIFMYGCFTDCEKALAAAIKSCYDAVSNCTGGKKDPASVRETFDCAMDAADDCEENGIGNVHDAVNCGAGFAGCVPPLECPSNIVKCLNDAYDAFKKCMEMMRNRPRKAAARNGEEQTDNYSDTELDAKEKRAESVYLYFQYYEALQSNLRNIIGDGSWERVPSKDIAAMLAFVSENVGDDGMLPEGTALLDGKPASLDMATYLSFIERYNNSVKYEQTGVASENMFDYVLSEENRNKIDGIKERVSEMGYPSFSAFTKEGAETSKDYMNTEGDASKGICSVITLQFKQTMVMTRQAFRGTLTVTNGNEEVAMQNVKLLVKIRDEEGNIVGSREFAVTAETLDGFEGEKDLGTGWTLAPQGTGTATVLFIPSKYAAPVEPRKYSFGGVLSYTDPFTGDEINRELSPVTLTVNPSPQLDLNYFMQRNVLGDDALTPDRIESSVPAEFALVITNKGYGDATALKMTTEQPKIVDNRRGLAINFEIISSCLNGKESTMPIGNQIPTEFGNLEAGASTWAQWWFRSSLMGHFISYNVSATQLSSYGSEDMSLLDNVAVHELIHGMTVEDSPESSRAFLVNDISDALGAPDMLWHSDGSETDAVGETPASAVTVSEITDESCVVRIEPEASGWTYGCIDAPWPDTRTVTGVLRLSDGKELPADNFWITSVTLHNSSAPVYEERLHFAVNLPATADSYRLTLERKPENELQVVSFEGVPAEGTVRLSAVKSIDVRFSKPIKPETFDTSDVSFTVQGKKLSSSEITITPVNETLYTLTFGEKLQQKGYCVLSVDTYGITDTEGHNGSEAKAASWIQLNDGQVTISAVADPADGGTITPTAANCAYGEAITLKAEPAEGYDFIQWLNGNDDLGQAPSLELRPVEDMALTAKFALKQFNLVLDCDNNTGAVIGNQSGIYAYGTEISAIAEPLEGYVFDHWEDSEGNIFSDKPEIEFAVNGDVHYTAIFKKTSVSVSHVTDNGVISIYPVPVKTRFHIHGNFTELRFVTVVNAAGTRNRIYHNLTPESPIDISTLIPGVYFVEVITELGRSSHRIVKL